MTMILVGASSLSLLTSTFAIALFLCVLVKALTPRKYDLREPPVVPSSAPFVGHVFGILRYGASYFKYLG